MRVFKMEVSLGYLENPENILIRRFSLNKEFLGEDTLKFEELGGVNIDGLFLSSEELGNDILSELEEENKYIPIQKGNKYSLNYSDFKNLNPLLSLTKLRDMNSSWVLKNNLILLENIFEIVSNLKESLLKERDTFLLDLWHLVKTNLGAFQFSLYYNDLVEGKKEIITRKITGHKIGEKMELTEIDHKILECLKKIPGNFYFFPEKQEIFVKMEIMGSPLLMTGGCLSISPLQRSLMKALKKGLH